MGARDLRLGGLVYLASRDGMSNDVFHAKCDGHGATVMICRASNRFTFGAFTTVPYSSVSMKTDAKTGVKTVSRDDKGTSHADKRAFLFRLEPSDPVKLEQINYFKVGVDPLPLFPLPPPPPQLPLHARACGYRARPSPKRRIFSQTRRSVRPGKPS
jgi:hypothetical protein